MEAIARRRPSRKAPAPPPVFSQVDATHTDTRQVQAALAHLLQKPRRLRHVKNWPMALRSVTDYVTAAPTWLTGLRAKLIGYPRPFRKVQFRSWDGTLLSAAIGVHTEGGQETVYGSRGRPIPREGILLLPGMFTTKDNAVQKARALKIFKEWGYHVLALDLRGFGESSRVYNTGGWKEAEDVEAALEYFRAHVPLQKIHIYAESLGATASILAAGRAAERGFRLVDGGILALNPYADARREIEFLSRRPVTRNQFFMVQWFFLQLLRLGGHKYDTFVEYVRDAARSYGVTLDELYRRSSPKHVVARVNCPLLILNSKDDPIVPVSEARTFQRLLRGRANPTAWLLPWGNHCAFEMADPDWFWNLLREFFDFYCLLPPRTARA